MFCSNCGSQVPDGQAFCSNCGANVAGAQAQPQQPQQNYYQQPQQPQYQQPQQPMYQQPQQPTYQQPMYQQPQQAYGQGATIGANIDWFKIMSYFAMFAVALFSAITAIVTFTGSIYGYKDYEGDWAEAMYRSFDGLQAVDIIHAIGLLGLAAYGVYAWSRFYGRYADAQKHVSYVYLAASALEALYLILILIMVDSDAHDFVSFVLFIMLLLVNVAMFAINKFYYFKNFGYQFTRR